MYGRAVYIEYRNRIQTMQLNHKKVLYLVSQHFKTSLGSFTKTCFHASIPLLLYVMKASWAGLCHVGLLWVSTWKMILIYFGILSNLGMLFFCFVWIKYKTMYFAFQHSLISSSSVLVIPTGRSRTAVMCSKMMIYLSCMALMQHLLYMHLSFVIPVVNNLLHWFSN